MRSRWTVRRCVTTPRSRSFARSVAVSIFCGGRGSKVKIHHCRISAVPTPRSVRDRDRPTARAVGGGCVAVQRGEQPASHTQGLTAFGSIALATSRRRRCAPPATRDVARGAHDGPSREGSRAETHWSDRGVERGVREGVLSGGRVLGQGPRGVQDGGGVQAAARRGRAADDDVPRQHRSLKQVSAAVDPSPSARVDGGMALRTFGGS